MEIKWKRTLLISLGILVLISGGIAYMNEQEIINIFPNNQAGMLSFAGDSSLSKADYNYTEKQIHSVMGEPIEWINIIHANKKDIKVNVTIERINMTIKKITYNGAKIEKNILSKQEINYTEQVKDKYFEIRINENILDYEIHYFTPAPTITSEKTAKNGKKTVEVTSNSELEYKNVFIEVDIPTSLGIVDIRHLKIKWVEEDSLIQYRHIEDTDKNGIYDRVSWYIPHMSNQTFEIIKITKAEHLNSSKDFISDIFNETRELDDIWSEEIPSNDFVRVWFETNLTNDRDIKVYGRITNGNPYIEIYEVNESILIANITSIAEDGYSRVFLDNLIGSQDVFDLKIGGGSIEIDHIIDPFVEISNEDTGQAETFTLAYNPSAGSDRLAVIVLGFGFVSGGASFPASLDWGGQTINLVINGFSPSAEGGDDSAVGFYVANETQITARSDNDIFGDFGQEQRYSVRVALYDDMEQTIGDTAVSVNDVTSPISLTVDTDSGDLVLGLGGISRDFGSLSNGDTERMTGTADTDNMDWTLAEKTGIASSTEINFTSAGELEYASMVAMVIVPIAIGGDTCTYTSGDWAIECSDFCNITSNVVIDGSDMILSGSGSFNVQANISNFDNVFKDDACFVNKLNEAEMINS